MHSLLFGGLGEEEEQMVDLCADSVGWSEGFVHVGEDCSFKR